MCREQFDMTYDDLNPTFLFTWKGTRVEDEKRYHSHDFIEIAFILSGTGKYHIDGNLYTVEKGDILIFNPGISHQGLVSDKNNPTTEFFVGFFDVQFKGMNKNIVQLKNSECILHAEDELRQKIFKICSSMSTEYMTDRPGRYFMLKAYLIQLLVLIMREQIDTPVRPMEGYTFDSVNKTYLVEQIITYLEDHYPEKISLDRIAKNMYLSPFYISKIFKNETGETPINHLIKIRLEKAKVLLETENQTEVRDIACRVGYDDAYHFSKLFKKHYGVSPSKVKQRVIR